MTRLLLVRHGESEFNNTHRFAGFVDIGLTETGRRQAERLRDRLADEKIDAVYTSNLKRARTTAEIVISGRNLNITECPELSEISYGDIEGLTFSEIQQKYPVLADQIRKSDLAMEFPGGEKFLDFIKRVESFKERLVKHSDSESVLIVAHGGPLRTLLCSLLDISQESWWQLRIDNASLSIVDTYPIESNDKLEPTDKTKGLSRRVILSLFNETSYLSEIPKYKPPPLYRLNQKSLEEEAGRSNILVRLFEPVDIAVMKTSFTRIGIYQNWLEGYLSEQEKGERTILVAYSESSFAGFVTVKWHADYHPFAEKGIPIIEDLNVLPAFRRRRIASALVDEAEKKIFSRSAVAGIGVGVYADYGPAQRMYARRGYIPDGMGLYHKGQRVEPGFDVFVDDDLILYMLKERVEKV